MEVTAEYSANFIYNIGHSHSVTDALSYILAINAIGGP